MAGEAAEAAAPQGARRRANRLVFWSAVFAIVATTLAATEARVPHPDLAFYLYAAARVLDGAVLYRDIVEINPPLIIWLNLPAVLLGRLLGISDTLAYWLIVSLVIGAILVLSHRIASRLRFEGTTAGARYVLLLLWFALFPLARGDFGQREHLVLAFLLPYLLLAGTRLQGAHGSAREALVVGMLAGIGLSLKPHFLLAWLAIEAFRRAGANAARWRLTPELVGVALSVGCYLAAVVALTPDYFQVIAVLGRAYTSFMRRSLLDVTLLAPAVPLVLFALLAFIVHRRYASSTTLASLFAAAILGAYASAAVQQKGFTYHYYPAVALAVTLLALIASGRSLPTNWIARAYVRLARAVAITTAVMAAGATLFDAIRPRQEEARALAGLGSVVRARAHGTPVGVLSYTINSAFPLMNEAGTTLASRFPCLWPLATSYWDSLKAGGQLRYHTPTEMGPAERFMWNAVRDDLVRARPNVLVILRPGRDVAHNGLRRLNYAAYFGRRPELAEFLSSYQLIEGQGEYLIYERVEADAARIGPPPSFEPGQLEAPRPTTPDLGIDLVDGYSRARLIVFGLVWMGVLMFERRWAVARSIVGDASGPA
ncbi:MAG: hypothetical protein ACREOC_09975 [Gemmatimonadales bacterium]